MKPASCLASLVLALAMALDASADTEPIDTPKTFLVLTVSALGGTPATLAVEEGAQAVYASETLGISIGVEPRIRDAELKLIELAVFEVELQHGEVTAVARGQLLGELESLVDEEVFVAVAGMPVGIVIGEITEDPWSPLGFDARRCQDTPPNQHLMPRELCCVDCRGLFACAALTVTSCGTCCSADKITP